MTTTTLQEALSRLWKEEQTRQRLPASLFTLLLYLPSRSLLPRYERLVHTLLQKIPCRLIWILQEESLSSLRTSVGSLPFSQGGSSLFCEEIRLETPSSLLERIPFLLLPHLIPDLPVYLLWAEDPTHQPPLLSSLAAMAQRVIFDTAAPSSLPDYAQALLSLLDALHGEVGDLHWSSTMGWRHLLATTFAQAEDFAAFAGKATLRFAYTPGEGPYPMEVLYLQAWLAARLSGIPLRLLPKKEGVELDYKTPEGMLHFLLTPHYTSDFAPSTLTDIEILGGENQATYTFKRRPHSQQVFVQHSDSYQCDLPYCRTLSEGGKLLDELFYPPVSTHYRDMLTLLASETLPWPHYQGKTHA